MLEKISIFASTNKNKSKMKAKKMAKMPGAGMAKKVTMKASKGSIKPSAKKMTMKMGTAKKASAKMSYGKKMK